VGIQRLPQRVQCAGEGRGGYCGCKIVAAPRRCFLLKRDSIQRANKRSGGEDFSDLLQALLEASLGKPD